MVSSTCYTSETAIEEIVDHFKNKSLPKEQWTHEAHLTVGVWFLKNHSKDEATCFIRTGIINYNMATGGENTPTSGYHETMTLFWISILSWYLTKHSALPLREVCNKFLLSRLSQKDFRFEFYNRETLLSVKARAQFVASDKK